MDDENGQDQTLSGQPEDNDSEHASERRDRIDAIDETEVSDHVNKEGAEALDVRKGRFDLPQRHLGRSDHAHRFHLVLNVRFRDHSEGHLSKAKPPDAGRGHGEGYDPRLNTSRIIDQQGHHGKVNDEEQSASEVARCKSLV